MAFLEIFGIKPWERDKLTGSQVRSLARRVDDLEREAEKREAEARAHG